MPLSQSINKHKNGGDEAWCRQLTDAGFSPGDIQHIMDHIKQFAWLQTIVDSCPEGAKNPEVLLFKVTEQFYVNTWISQDFIHNVLEVFNGSSAGMPLADLIYSLAMSRVLVTIRDTLAMDGNASSLLLTDGSRFDVHESSFVDDGAFIVVGPAGSILEKTTKVAETVVTVYRMFNMSINWNIGKTECSFNLYGPGKKTARAALDKLNKWLPVDDGGFTKHMAIASWYKHLGTALEANGDPGTEVCIRTGLMKNETFKLRKHVLGNPLLPIKHKIGILQAYINSKGTYQAGTWPTLKPHVYRKFHGAILSMYRSVVGKHSYDEREKVSEVFSDDDVIYEFGFMCPRTMLRMSKLLFFARMVAKGATDLLQLARNSITSNDRLNTWSNSLMEDIKWISLSPDLSSFVGVDFTKSCDLFRENGRKFKNSINKYCRTPHANISCNWTTNDKLAAMCTEHVVCRVCKKDFGTSQACGAHEFSAHGLKHPLRNHIEANTCTICLKVFDNREAAINHARYKSKICYANLIARGPRLSNAESDAIDALDHLTHNNKVKKGKRMHTVDKLCCFAHGPLLPVIIPEGDTSTFGKWLDGRMTVRRVQ